MQSRASSFNWQYPLLSLRSSSSFLRLLPHLLVTSICPFIFPSVTCCRRQFLYIILYNTMWSGSGSSVSIATDYRLAGPGSNPGGDEIFRSSGPNLGPTQPPVQWVLGLSRGVKCGRGVLLTTHPLLVPRSCKSRAIPLPTLWATPGL